MSTERVIVPGKRLGRKAVKTDTRTLKLARYLTVALPAPPPAKDWTDGIADFGMMRNDVLGDCTIAGCGHAVQVWTANTSNVVTLSDVIIESTYSAWDGYVPGNSLTDMGGIELDVLNHWRKDGIAGHSLMGYAAANVKNLTEVRQAIALFGGVYIGLALPLTAQNQTTWDVVSRSGNQGKAGSWGGHCVFVPTYHTYSESSQADDFVCITWGVKQIMTAAFWQKYCDESYALFGADWLKDGMAPSGFNAEQLSADLAAIQ